MDHKWFTASISFNMYPNAARGIIVIVSEKLTRDAVQNEEETDFGTIFL